MKRLISSLLALEEGKQAAKAHFTGWVRSRRCLENHYIITSDNVHQLLPQSFGREPQLALDLIRARGVEYRSRAVVSGPGGRGFLD